MYREPTRLRILFPHPGFFVNDPRVEVDLDGTRIYEGSFTSGFDHVAVVSPGTHTLVTRIAVGPVLRPKRYTFEIGDAPAYTATLRYSRLWGNFTTKLALSES